jgi:hypothetical protein
VLDLRGQPFPPRRRQLVKPGLAVLFGYTPFRPDQALRLKPVQRRIERPLLDAEDVGRDQVDAIRNGQPVSRLVLQGAQDQHVERSVDQVGLFLGHEQLTQTV